MMCAYHSPTPADGAAGPTPPIDPAARFAHELNNLLDGSLRNVSLAINRLSEEMSVEESLDSDVLQKLLAAANGMVQMASLLRQWKWSKPDDLPLPVYDQGLSLSEAIERAAKVVGGLAAAHQVTIEIKVPDPLGRLPAGPLAPVIYNGLRNALESVAECDAGGTVTIGVGVKGELIELRIEDDGPGIDDQLPRDPDGLVSPGASTKGAGHGLGLAISRDIVSAIGGKLMLEDRPDGGARLIVRYRVDPQRFPGVEA